MEEDSLWKGVVESGCLGRQEFRDQVLSKETEKQPKAVRVMFEQARRALEEVRAERWAEFADRHGDPGRDLLMYIMRESSGESFRSIARECGIKRAGTAVLAVRRFERRLRTDKTLRKLAHRVMNLLNLPDL